MKRNTGENSLLNENHPPNPNPDADGSHDKPEKQTAIHPTRADYSDDISDPHPMTDDELVRYNEQVERSAGFEIDPIPGVNVLNLEDARSGMLCSDQAIRKYNISEGISPASGPALNPNRDADEISHDKPEKQMAILPKNIKKQVDLFDFFDGFSVLHRMTEDEDRRYSEQVESTGGFEVDPFPGVVAFGLIQPWDINAPDNARRCILYSHNAIDTYNTKYGTPQLQFVRVLKAMCQGCDVFRCYVTFEAKDLADGGQTKIYQAVVRCQIPIDVNISTLSFRECVQLVRGSGFHGKKWNWKGH